MPKATARPTPKQAEENGIDEPVLEDIGELEVVKTPRGWADWADDLFAPYDEVDEHLKVLFWGREGSGKTIDLAAATQLGRVLVINAEGGLKKRALLANGVKTENLVVFPRPGQELTYQTLEAALFRVKADLMDDPKSWFLVGVDSITELATAFTEAASDENFEKAKRKNAAWKPGLSDEFFVDRSDYGVSTKVLRKILRMLRDMPVHVAITALERRDVDEDTSKVMYGPAVGPALQTAILGYVDLVLYCKAPDEDRDFFRAQTKAVGKARAKDRTGAFPPVLVNPTFPRIIGYNENWIVAETDPDQAKLLEVKEEAPKATKAPGGTRTRPSRAKATKTPPEAEKTAPEDGGQ